MQLNLQKTVVANPVPGGEKGEKCIKGRPPF